MKFRNDNFNDERQLILLRKNKFLDSLEYGDSTTEPITTEYLSEL